MQPSQLELFQNTLSLLVLKVVALGSVHGYAIVQRIRQMSDDALQIPQGSLYPVLYRLEERGYIRGQWRETEQGRMAKFYSITRKGLKQLGAEQHRWQRAVAGITAVLSAIE